MFDTFGIGDLAKTHHRWPTYNILSTNCFNGGFFRCKFFGKWHKSRHCRKKVWDHHIAYWSHHPSSDDNNNAYWNSWKDCTVALTVYAIDITPEINTAFISLRICYRSHEELQDWIMDIQLWTMMYHKPLVGVIAKDGKTRFSARKLVLGLTW